MGTRTTSYLEVKENGLQEIITGFAWLIKLAQGDSSKKSALIATPLLKTLEDDVAPILGKQTVALLAEGNEVNIDVILKLTLMTERKTRDSWPGPILAVYPTRKLLELIDGLSGVTDLLVISRRIWSIKDWVDTWRVSPLGVSPLPPVSSTICPVLEAALKTLTLKLSGSAGLAQPSDRAATVSLFEILHKDGFTFDPKQVRAWLISKGGWKPALADQIQEIAEGVLAGKRFDIEKYVWSERILEVWKAEAMKAGSDPTKFGSK